VYSNILNWNLRSIKCFGPICYKELLGIQSNILKLNFRSYYPFTTFGAFIFLELYGKKEHFCIESNILNWNYYFLSDKSTILLTKEKGKILPNTSTSRMGQIVSRIPVQTSFTILDQTSFKMVLPISWILAQLSFWTASNSSRRIPVHTSFTVLDQTSFTISRFQNPVLTR
jgi:hypothetical protein